MHFVHRGTFKSTEKFIAKTEALNFHYRDLCLKDDCRDNNVTDRTARKFGTRLWRSVNEVCGKIFEDGVCPFKKYYRPRPRRYNKIEPLDD